ncbi:hypothetical protein N7452_011353 [Penicillium brevicompactum]|uniref:Uncharacterized protein n=1 Tax=Penicillium brevicompactum TaxID=5074 RepID=A0A9W9Q2D3_PENBR|nr:hypothetical protein N7452_011353 [Penicillium brevicompactum]
MSDMWRERVIETNAWNEFEAAMDALDAVLAMRGGGGASSQAVVLASQTRLLPFVMLGCESSRQRALFVAMFKPNS